MPQALAGRLSAAYGACGAPSPAACFGQKHGIVRPEVQDGSTRSTRWFDQKYKMVRPEVQEGSARSIRPARRGESARTSFSYSLKNAEGRPAGCCGAMKGHLHVHTAWSVSGCGDPLKLLGPPPYRCPGQCREVAYLRIGETHLHEIAHLQLLLLDTPQPPGERIAERGV